jgi:hypothetical protein
MGSFRNADTGDAASKYVLKFEAGKQTIVKILDSDYLEQWFECWPTFLISGGKVTRRFVSKKGDNDAFRPIKAFKMVNNIEDMFSSVQQKKDREMLVGNWGYKGQNATLAIVGVEQKVKADGKIKTKIEWDRQARILQFGIKMLKQLEAINHNPTLIEKADEVGTKTGKFTMCNPDDPNSNGLMCVDVYAIRIEKTNEQGQINYILSADKLVGKISNVENIEVVKKALEDHCASSSAEDVESYLSENSGGSVGGTEEAPAEEEVVEDEPVAPPPAKKAVAAPVKKAAAAPAAKAPVKKAVPPVEEEIIEEVVAPEEDIPDPAIDDSDLDSIIED